MISISSAFLLHTDYLNLFLGYNFINSLKLTLNNHFFLYVSFFQLKKEDWDQAEAMIRKLKDN